MHATRKFGPRESCVAAHSTPSFRVRPSLHVVLVSCPEHAVQARRAVPMRSKVFPNGVNLVLDPLLMFETRGLGGTVVFTKGFRFVGAAMAAAVAYQGTKHSIAPPRKRASITTERSILLHLYSVKYTSHSSGTMVAGDGACPAAARAEGTLCRPSSSLWPRCCGSS